MKNLSEKFLYILSLFAEFWFIYVMLIWGVLVSPHPISPTSVLPIPILPIPISYTLKFSTIPVLPTL